MDMNEPVRILSPDDERAVVSELARRALATAAPDELVIFDETASDYVRDPQAALAGQHRDEAVGFGLELALITPYVIAVASEAVHMLASIVGGAVKDEGGAAARSLIRRLFRLPNPDDAATPAPLSVEQARQVRGVAFARATDLGIPEQQAGLLADAITGGLVVAT